MNYSGSYATPRLDLGRAMWEYMLGSNTFIGTKILPIFKTMKESAAFSKITRASILRSRNVKRAKRGAYARDTFEAKDQTYQCEERGFEGKLDDSERAMYASDFDAEMAISRIAMNIVLTEQEKDIVTMLFNETTWAGAPLFTDYSAAPWSTAGSDIIGQVDAGKEKVRANTGMKANALILGAGNLVNIKKNTAIRAAIQYTAIPTEEAILNALKGLFGVKHIFVGDSVKNTADEGQAFVGADVWPASHVMVARVCETEDLGEPGLGRTMLWAADSPDNQTIEEYREEQTRSQVLRARQNVDEVVFDPAFAHLMEVDA